MVVADAEKSAEGKGETQEKESTPSQQWEAYLATLSKEQQEVYNQHIHGLKSALQKEREAAKNLPAVNKELEALRAAEIKRKEALMTETELLKKRAEEAEASKSELERSFNSTRLKYAVIQAATKLNFEDPEDAFTMTRSAIEKLEIAEDGTVEGASEKLKELAEAKPYLIKKPVDKNKQNGGSFGTPAGGKKVSSGGDKELDKVKLPTPF